MLPRVHPTCRARQVGVDRTKACTALPSCRIPADPCPLAHHAQQSWTVLMGAQACYCLRLQTGQTFWTGLCCARAASHARWEGRH